MCAHFIINLHKTVITHNQIGLAVGDTNEEIEKATFTRVMLQVSKAMHLGGL